MEKKKINLFLLIFRYLWRAGNGGRGVGGKWRGEGKKRPNFPLTVKFIIVRKKRWKKGGRKNAEIFHKKRCFPRFSKTLHDHNFPVSFPPFLAPPLKMIFPSCVLILIKICRVIKFNSVLKNFFHTFLLLAKF